MPGTILSTGESAVKKMNKAPVFMELPFQTDRVGWEWGKPQTKQEKEGGSKCYKGNEAM